MVVGGAQEYLSLKGMPHSSQAARKNEMFALFLNARRWMSFPL